MQRRLIFVTLASAVLASPSSAKDIGLHLDLRGGTLPLDGEIVVRADSAPATEVVYPLVEGGEILAPSSASSVTCRGEGLWCPMLPISGDELRLPVFPAMEITGRLAPVGRGVVPATGTVQGLVHGSAQPQGLELRHALVLDEGRFAFTAPRASLDLRFAFPGAAPVYRWGLAPPAPEAQSPSARGRAVLDLGVLDLGVLDLHPGGSISGWARNRENELPVTGAEVVAVPVTAAGENPPLHSATGSTDARGFFQLHALAPGTYRLKMSGAGRVPQVLESIDVQENAETMAGTVLLSPPLRLSVQVEPPRHPEGEPWTLSLRPVHRLPEDVPVEVEASPEGTAALTTLRATDYYVKIQSTSGDTYLTEHRTISGDEWLTLEVPVVRVEGTVRLGGEPISSTVELAAGNGDNVRLESNEEGEISGWMQRPARPWLMATVTWREGTEPHERLVEVVPVVRDDIVELDVKLPSGAIFGDVVDAEGRPQSGLRVLAIPMSHASRHTEVRVETDEAGRFHLTGLERIRYLVRAGGNGWPASEAVMLDLESDLAGGELRLVVWPTRKLSIQVSADDHPIAGASVSLTTLGRVPASLVSTTDSRGRAAFDVPEDADRAVVTVLAPSRLLWTGCLPIEGEQLSLPLPGGAGGTLSLTLIGRNDLPPILGGRQVLVSALGGFVAYGSLVNWNRLRDAPRELRHEAETAIEVLQVPALAAGSYAVTWSGEPDWMLAARTCGGNLGQLDWVSLSPGAEAALSLDVGDLQSVRLEALTENR